jgi:hypothetical protein
VRRRAPTDAYLKGLPAKWLVVVIVFSQKEKSSSASLPMTSISSKGHEYYIMISPSAQNIDDIGS